MKAADEKKPLNVSSFLLFEDASFTAVSAAAAATPNPALCRTIFFRHRHEYKGVVWCSVMS
jgi:hypothetical protein